MDEATDAATDGAEVKILELLEGFHFKVSCTQQAESERGTSSLFGASLN